MHFDTALKHMFLTLFFPAFPFDPPEYIRKSLFIYVFRGRNRLTVIYRKISFDMSGFINNFRYSNTLESMCSISVEFVKHLLGASCLISKFFHWLEILHELKVEDCSIQDTKITKFHAQPKSGPSDSEKQV